MAHKTFLIYTLQLVAAVLVLLTTPAIGQGLLGSCPPSTPNGTFPFPIDTSNFCISLGLEQPSNAVTCSLTSVIQGIVAPKKGPPLVCNKQAPSGPVTNPNGGWSVILEACICTGHQQLSNNFSIPTTLYNLNSQQDRRKASAATYSSHTAGTCLHTTEVTALIE